MRKKYPQFAQQENGVYMQQVVSITKSNAL